MLDDWLPDATVRTRHRRTANAGPDALWKAATGIRLADTRRLGRLVGWRIPGVEPSQTYHELFREYPFTVLDESEHGLVSGLVRPDLDARARLPGARGPEAFAAWDEPGTVRVAFHHWVRPLERRAPRCSRRRACSPSTPSRGCG